MRVNSKFLIIFFILLLLLTPVTARGRYHHVQESVINSVDSYASLDDVNFLKISQHFHCRFRDKNEITLSIPFDDNQTIYNLVVDVPGYFRQLEITESSNSYKVKIYLYEDESQSDRVLHRDVDINLNYLVNNAVTQYDDVAVIDYLIWDSAIGVGSFTSIFTLPSSQENVTIYNYPDIIKDQTWLNNNTFKVSVVPYHRVQQEILIPHDSLNNTDNVNIIHEKASDMLKQKHERMLQHDNDIDNNLKILEVLVIILALIPFAVRLISYQRLNDNISHKKDSNLKAIDVNYLFSNNVGNVDLNAFYAVFINLIRKNVFTYTNISGNPRIRLNPTKISKLNNYECVVVDYVQHMLKHPITNDPFFDGYLSRKLNSKKQYDGEREDITFKEIDFQLKSGDKLDYYLTKFQNEYMEYNMIDVSKYFDNRLYKMMNIYLKVMLSLSVLGFFVFMGLIRTNLYNRPLFSVVGLFIVTIMVYMYLITRKNNVFGRWTSFGLNEYNIWKNYRENLLTSQILRNQVISLDDLSDYVEYCMALDSASYIRINLKMYLYDNGYRNEDLEDYPILQMVNDGVYDIFREGYYEPTISSKFTKLVRGSFKRY